MENEILKMDGYDECILGVLERNSTPYCIIYDKNCVIKSLVKQGMSEVDAIEFYEFNQLGSWVGEGTPGFLIPWDDFG
jgi:hypothetical protein